VVAEVDDGDPQVPQGALTNCQIERPKQNLKPASHHLRSSFYFAQPTDRSQVDETQVFPKGGSIAEGAGRSPAPSMIDSPLRRFSTRAGAQAQLVRRAARVLEMNSKNISKNNKKVTNLAALALAGRGAHLPGEAWVNSLDDETFARLERCVASGLENADSSIGCCEYR
jgi:hypothetical protein